ncbi:MAG TPA: GAF domain-containing protein, partial [Acidimicrobiales bacterium]|nr:GAF domain-containing protein [Acidimicrobiales bacterium]
MASSDPPRDRDPAVSQLMVLAQAAKALHGERDVERALDWARRAIGTLTGLPEVAVCLLPRHGSATWSVGDSTMAFPALGDPRMWPLTRRGLDAGHPVLVTDLASAERALPVTAQLARLVPLASVLVAPVLSRDGLAQGVIVAGDIVPRDLDEGQVEAVRALAAHLGVALDNSATLARMAQVEARGKEVVHALQEAVRPPAPVIPFTELGVHYVAADPDAPTGGDLYDWLVLP